jgi:formate dehydrogenase gamma subunit
MTTEQKPEKYTRFSRSQRMEHFILLVSMIGLAVTGLVQRYADVALAKTLINLMGGIEGTRVIHRFMAMLLVLEAIYHGGALSYKVFVEGSRITMVPTLRDLRDVRDWVLYNLGLKKDHPRLPRYNFGEKVEYLAVVWGTVLMGLTGFMLLNPIATTKILPGSVIPVARAAHSAEAVLAVLSILTWHMYNVHFRRFNRSMFTGKLSREAMEEEHAEELEAIEHGDDKIVLPPEILASRKRRFWPYATVMTVLLVAGVRYFVTFEETSITTVPRREEVIFAQNIIPEEGDANIGATLWPTLRCARCHGDAATGTDNAPALIATPLNFEDFLLKVRSGGTEMPAINAEEISDAYLFHVWTWLQSVSVP